MALVHKVSVKGRKISIANRNFVQGGVNSDIFQIELDQEFAECERVLVSMKRDDALDTVEPIVFELPVDKQIKIPSEILSEVGTFTIGVIGYDADGNARITTEALSDGKNCSVVEASFIVDSENPPSEEQQDIFQQLEEFVKDAQASLDKFDDASMSIGTVETLEPGTQATANFTGEGLQKVLNLGIPKGEKGDKGDRGDPGEQGIQGIPGVDGQDGQDGAPGADGFSPTVEVSKDGSVTTISITDKTGVKTAEISDGAKGDKGDPGEKGDPGDPGADGQNGADGFSPTVEVSKSGTVTTISITDKTGPKTAQINDGTKGDKGDPGNKGDPGTAATIAVGSVTGLAAGASPTVNNSGTANAAVLDFGIPKGDKGDKGDTGDPGYTPQRGVDYWTAEDVEQVVTDAKTQAVAELAEIGNVPKKTVTDLVAHGEDAYAQKPIEVRVKGKTWVNRWPVIEGTQNGITVTTDETGLIRVVGTATGEVHIAPFVTGIAPGKAITISGTATDHTLDSFYVYLECVADSGNVCARTANDSNDTITVPSDTTTTRCGIYVKNGTAVDTSFRVMLVDGTEAPDCFTPCASIASVETGNLVTSGKNLLPAAGITDVGGSNNATEYVDLLPGTYTISAQGGPFGQIIVRGDDGTDYSIPNYNTSKATFTLNRSARVRVLFWISNAAGVFASNPQLELGSTATAYEPPNVATTTLPEVELRSLPNGTCDELVIKADGSCEVDRKLGKNTIDAEHPITIKKVYPASGDDLPYVLVSNLFPPFASYEDSVEQSMRRYVHSSTWPFVENIKSRGMYRSWNAIVFADERFTDTETAQSIINETGGTFVAQVPTTTELQSPVTLPALPAPTFNQYHDADVPSDTSTTYARDINIVLANLEAVQTALLGGE